MCDVANSDYEICVVCGSPIWARESIARGYGSECAAAIDEARRRRVFANEELKREYYGISATMLINAMAAKNFRSSFRKSFQESVVKQGNWLSKKQADICRSILFDYDPAFAEKFSEDEKTRKQEFWKKIPVTREDIEIARHIIREKRGEK